MQLMLPRTSRRQIKSATQPRMDHITTSTGEEEYRRALNTLEQISLKRDEISQARAALANAKLEEYIAAASQLHHFNSHWIKSLTELVTLASPVFPGNGWEANFQQLNDWHHSHIAWVSNESSEWSRLLPDLRQVEGSEDDRRQVLDLLFNIESSLPAGPGRNWIGTIKCRSHARNPLLSLLHARH